MKSKPVSFLMVCLATACSALLLDGCHEKGCTDPKAMNYSITADVDDGTCITCNETQTQLGYLVVDMVDNNSGSAHYGQTIARFSFDQELLHYSNNLCGSETCNMTVKVKNLISQNMDLPFWIQSSGPVSLSRSGDVTIHANETVDVTAFFSNIQNINCISIYADQLTAQLNGTVFYF